MTKAQILDELAQDQGLSALVNPLAESQLNERRVEGNWTIMECLEHIYLTEALVIGLLLQLDESQPVNEERLTRRPSTETIASLSKRTAKYKAPDMVAPQGSITTRDQFFQVFGQGRQRLLEALQKGKLDFDSRQTVKHPLLGYMTPADWMQFLVTHTRRHRLQIAEILGL